VASCKSLASNAANYCKTNPLVPQKCPVSCGICKPAATPAPTCNAAAVPQCAAPCQLVDTDGDGCDDRCTCPCPSLTCTGARVPSDTTGDGCPDQCVSNCPNHGSKGACKKDTASRCAWTKSGCQEVACSSVTAKKKCLNLTGCTWGALQCYDPTQGVPTQPTVVCSTVTSKKICNRQAACKWSTKKGGACNAAGANTGPVTCASHKKKKACLKDSNCMYANRKCSDKGPVAVDCTKLTKGQCNQEPACLYDKKRPRADRCYDPVCKLADVQAKYRPMQKTKPVNYQACVDFFENGKPGICECLKGVKITDMKGMTCLARAGETTDLLSATKTCHSGTAACLGPKNVLDCATMSASQFGPCIWEANAQTCGVHDGATIPCVSADFLVDSVQSVKSTTASQAACAAVAGGNASKTDMCDCLTSFDSQTAAKYAWCTLPGDTQKTGFQQYGSCL